MKWKEELFSGFVKGIGKTTAALTIMGVVSGMYFLIKSHLSTSSTKTDKSLSTKTTNTETEGEPEPESEIQIAHEEFTENRNKFKELLSKLV